MKRQTVNINYLQSLSWVGNNVVDWVSGGTSYCPTGLLKENHVNFAYGFDAAISSADGQYAFIYKRLSTKGLLLKNGEILREINRSFYHADTYEYPAAFTTVKGVTYLIHCPNDYCQLDFEEVETGKIVTAIVNRKPEDYFHSRLEVSPDNNYLLSKGWVWQPWDAIEVFDIKACLDNPLLLDRAMFTPKTGSEIGTACFIDNNNILLYATTEPIDDATDPVMPGHISIWNFKAGTFSKAVKVNGPCGNVFPISENYCWDTFEYPKIINLHTGEVVDKAEEIDTSQQRSSIIHYLADKLPVIAYNHRLQTLAVRHNSAIEFLSPSL